MSTAHLPSYTGHLDSLDRSPSYSVEPRLSEQRLSLNASSVTHPPGNYLTSSKKGDTKLRLANQEDGLELPEYASAGFVEGTVELSTTDNIGSVEVKVEGHLHLEENGEGGHAHHTLILHNALLWEDVGDSVCPSSLPFSVTLPTEFLADGRSYPLPPSYSTKLEGLPGFCASINYSVGTIVSKRHSIRKKLGINLGDTIVSTPFNYYPRTRPAVPLPSSLVPRTEGGKFREHPGWKLYHYTINANTEAGVRDVAVTFYLPAIPIFSTSLGIPFHITFESDKSSLVAFRPYAPQVDTAAISQGTRIQVMRQSTVDVKQKNTGGTNTAMWRIDYIGEATFRHAGDGATCMSFSGEVVVEPVNVTGFNVPGLSVQDAILLTVVPADGTKAPFVGIREVIPVRLTTDTRTGDVAALRRSAQGSQSHEKDEL
ncbi:hypothetical protein DFH06DRAFT_1051471 [Mycena polygramma]|nr:hypothetical protein DFH06DRAFT_1051471 [Mycena polygramma]